jgi:hypothetical protein
MALSIGVSVGSRIDIAGHLLQVTALVQPRLIVVTVDGGDDVVISDKDRKEIVPGLWVQVGIGQVGGCNRLAFEAPKTINVSRQA